MKKVLSIIFALIISIAGWSQNYPIQSTINITPPYSVYLSDYASMTSNKMMMTMTLKDPMEPNVNITLRITIRGNGIELRTRDDYRPQPIQLDGGVPLIISGSELESYLNPANLTFSGISKTEFMKTGKLPEGVYQFFVEAMSYDRPDVTLSNQGMAVAWLVLNDPPHWTLPMQNSLLTATYPQYVNFSWMPMNTGSPNAAFTTEYEFTIVELWPEDRAPGDAINSFAPLYQTTTSNTSLVYGPAEPELTPGRKYVCRLRAYDTESRDLFKNNGLSEILVFTFGQACLPPNTFNHSIISPEEARVDWTSLPGNSQFTLSYSEQNTDGTWSNWYHNEGIMPYSILKNLKPAHNYRYQLKAVCGTIESDYSKIHEFTTPAADTTQLECGKDMSIPDIDDSPPLPTLRIGDRINAAGFTALVTEAEGSNGTFSGKCILFVKTFGHAPITAEFENINVNQSMQLTGGTIKSVKGELKIHGLDGILDSLGLTGNDDVVADGDDGSDPNVGDPYEAGDSIIVTLGSEDFVVTGDTTIITAGGDTITTDFSQHPPIIVVNGDSTNVTTDELDFDGTGGGTGNEGDLVNPASDTTTYSINYVQFMAFQEPDEKTPGFDAYDHGITAYRNEYKDKKVNDVEYIIPWQSVEANGKPTKVNMLIDTDVPDSIDIRLKVEIKGMPLSFIASPDGDTLKILNLIGQGNKDRDLITASYIKDDGDEVPVGYLNLKSYNRQTFKVVIVPVDGEFNYDETALKNYLDKVYAPAIVSWEVDKVDPLDVAYDEGETNGLNTSRTFFSSFNAEMKNVIKAMENRGDYDKNAYYLFVMNKAEDENLNGLMPFNSHFGFLFTGNGPGQDKIFRTIAHELAHGVFKLRHNFDQFNEIEKRSTQNLMDYTTTPQTATVLRKFQWDEIINPRLIALGWSEESYSEADEKELENYRLKYNYVTGDGDAKGMEISFKNSDTLYILKPIDFELKFIKLEDDRVTEKKEVKVDWLFNDEDSKELPKERKNEPKYVIKTNDFNEEDEFWLNCKISKNLSLKVYVKKVNNQTELPALVHNFNMNLKEMLNTKLLLFKEKLNENGIDWFLIAGEADNDINKYAGIGMSNKFELDDKFQYAPYEYSENKSFETISEFYKDLMHFDSKNMSLYNLIIQKDDQISWIADLDGNIHNIESLKEYVCEKGANEETSNFLSVANGDEELHLLVNQYLFSFLKIKEIIENSGDE